MTWEQKGGGGGKKPYEGKMTQCGSQLSSGARMLVAQALCRALKGQARVGVQEEGLGRCWVVPQKGWLLRNFLVHEPFPFLQLSSGHAPVVTELIPSGTTFGPNQ